jgi:hypothetical protein
VSGQQTIREGRQWLHEWPAKDLFRHEATSWMDLIHQLDAPTTGLPSGSPVVVMVQSTYDWKSNHFAPCILSGRSRSAPFRDLLRHPLMRPCLVEVGHIGLEDALELLLLQDQHVVQTFLPNTPQEALADRIGAWCIIGSFENLDTTCPRHPSEARPKFAIVITNQVLGRLSIGCGFSQLLGHPGIGRRSSDSDMDHFPRLQFYDEEREERAKEQIGDLKEVTRPDLGGVGVQKGRPRWPRDWRGRTFLMYFWMVRLQTRMPNFNTSPRILSAPQSRLFVAISSSQGNRFGRDLRRMRSSL